MVRLPDRHDSIPLLTHRYLTTGTLGGKRQLSYCDGMNLDEALRSHGHRVTQARRVVWDVLENAGGHLNVHQISDRVHQLDDSINVSSVYRALALFDEMHLVRESRLEDDATTWEVRHEDAVIHLVCSTCGEVHHHDTELIDALRSHLESDANFAPNMIDVRVSGVCRKCAV